MNGTSPVLISLLHAVRKIRNRREINQEQTSNWYKTMYNKKGLTSNLTKVIRWISEYSNGGFYLDQKIVAFEDERDFVVFKLWYKE